MLTTLSKIVIRLTQDGMPVMSMLVPEVVATAVAKTKSCGTLFVPLPETFDGAEAQEPAVVCVEET